MHGPIPAARSSIPPMEEYIKAAMPVWESRWLTNVGSCHQQLERSLCEFLEVSYMALPTSGHLALEMTLAPMELTEEVITTPFTFASTTQAIIQNGLTPVLCDIPSQDSTMDIAKIEALTTPKTSAISPVHVYGDPCVAKETGGIAQRHGLKAIYDTAYVFSEELDGTGIGYFGDLSMFSFHATKVFHTIEGDGLVCRDEVTMKGISALENLGQYTAEDVGEVGGNAKMNEFRVMMGLCNLWYVETQIAGYVQVAMRYRETLGGVSGVCLRPERLDARLSCVYFPMTIDPMAFGKDGDTLCGCLQNKNIFPRKYFYPFASHFRCYQGGFPLRSASVAKVTAERALTLPLYSDMTTDDAEYICGTISEGKR